MTSRGHLRSVVPYPIQIQPTCSQLASLVDSIATMSASAQRHRSRSRSPLPSLFDRTTRTEDKIDEPAGSDVTAALQVVALSPGVILTSGARVDITQSVDAIAQSAFQLMDRLDQLVEVLDESGVLLPPSEEEEIRRRQAVDEIHHLRRDPLAAAAAFSREFYNSRPPTPLVRVSSARVGETEHLRGDSLVRAAASNHVLQHATPRMPFRPTKKLRTASERWLEQGLSGISESAQTRSESAQNPSSGTEDEV